jgi:selenoprotein W-related protein
LAEAVLTEFGTRIDAWTLVPGSGGVHEVEVDGELVFSKKETGRHPTAEEVVAAIRERMTD